MRTLKRGGLAAIQLDLLVLLGSAMLLLLSTTPSAPNEPPACKGRDLLEELARSDPKSYAKVMAEADAVPNGKAMLWKVEAEDRPASHLYGTIHLTDPRVTRLSPATEQALKSSHLLALEIDDPSPAHMASILQESMPTMIFADGRGLADMLSAQEIAQLKAVMGRIGLPEAFVKVLRPWAAAMFLALPPCELARGQAGIKFLDARLHELAVAQGLRTRGLETGGEQARAMARIPEATQVAWLKASLKTYDRAEDIIETMIAMYLQRRIAALFPLTVKLAATPGFDAAATEIIAEELSAKRNVRMAERALPYLKEGNAFIAVGALHLPGKAGLVELFRRSGFKVTAVE